MSSRCVELEIRRYTGNLKLCNIAELHHAISYIVPKRLKHTIVLYLYSLCMVQTMFQVFKCSNVITVKIYSRYVTISLLWFINKIDSSRKQKKVQSEHQNDLV